MSKKLTSTLLLFVVCIGFLAWGLSMFLSSLSAPVRDNEAVFYSILLIGCGIAAFIAIINLPRKNG